MTRWDTFTAAPHRMMMFAGTLQLVVAILYWGAVLMARYTGIQLPLEAVLVGSSAHGYLMLYGLFPYFIFGFLMTTYPRWMNGPLVEPSRYIAAFLCMAAGSLLVYAGLFTHTTLLGLGIVIHACGWGIGKRGWAGGTALSHAGSNTMWFLVMWLAPEKNFAVIAATNIAGPDAEKGCDEAASAMIGKWLGK